MMNKKKATTLILIGFLIAIFCTCSKKNPTGAPKTTIPYGYHSDYNYLSVLRSGAQYAYESIDGYPVFTYQDPSNEHLVELKNNYNLENVAGNGDELSQIFNLLSWVNDRIRHDGSSTSPDPENSLNILTYCQATGNGVNCVMMAIVLNEVYLSMGFKSRVIQGNGKEWVFNGEWHAYNIVYSQTLGKWLFVDPTNCAYFTDDNGNLMSLRELRENLIQGNDLHLNSDTKYNGNRISEFNYLHYLTKNIYRFSCSVHSAFDNSGFFYISEPYSNSFFHLDPENDRQDGIEIVLNYYTSNPDFFWQKP
ncbi:transglutaminase-like domain-containing protein [candidate division KSB1 bacterium]